MGGFPSVRFSRRHRTLVALMLAATLISVPDALPDSLRAAGDPPVDEPFLADVDLNDVTVDRALRFLAELYDVSIATSQLPATLVTIRLRGVSLEDALESVAVAAGVTVEKRGSVVLVAPKALGDEARKIVRGPFFSTAGADLDWIDDAGVEVRRIGADTALLEGPENAVQAVAEALRNARHGSVVDRVFHLGAAAGEETLKAVRPILEPDLESASYDSSSHLLTVSALPSTLDRLEPLLVELLRSPTQFEIEVRVVEVSRSALERLGAQGFFRLEATGGVLTSTFPLENLDDSARYFPSANDLATLVNTANVGGAGVNRAVEPGSLEDVGFRFGRVDWRGTGLLIEFLEQSGDARVMATPKVTALDNREARISMVTTLRIPTFTQNAAFATTTVSGIEEVDVGTTLEVRPRRGQANEILLLVKPEVSELAPSFDVFNQGGLTQSLPVVTRRRTETEVILESGETLVIGGLVREREAESVGKTPGLGDIPWIGRAFRHKARDTESSELLVFVTPRELPPADERRAKVRVDEKWIPAGLAARVHAARGLTSSSAAANRVAGVRTLERLDSELREQGLDVGTDVVILGADPSLEVRVAAALFLLRWRPSTALGELVRFADSRAVALSALAAPIAPHLRAALAELVARSEGGTEMLVGQLSSAVDSADATSSAHLLDSLSMVAPERATEVALALVAAAGEESLAISAGDLLERANRTAEPAGQSPPAGEPALAWTGAPGEIEIRGRAADVVTLRQALELLAAKAPDLRHMVGFALAEIDAGADDTFVDPIARTARVVRAEPIQLAHRMVRLATLVFEWRVRGTPPRGQHGLAQAVREEIHALERLTGAPCPPGRADSTVRQVLRAVSSKEAADASAEAL